MKKRVFIWFRGGRTDVESGVGLGILSVNYKD